MRNVLTLVNVGQYTTLCDCDVAEQLVQLLVVSDGELKMTWDDTGLLVVTSSVTGQFEDFSSQVLEDSCEVDGSACWIRVRWMRSGRSKPEDETHQHRHAERSCPCGGDGGHDRRGMPNRPWMND